ncbi:MAG TPA: orotidine-5'-phosphate decarboxylase [Gemmatimonadaceae bacterium]|nr:orotidine-5'-phosphate decarboxylase [Gemmatimonadaceae bacterium]
MTRALPIVALDVPDSGRALGIVDLLGDQCRFYKIGSELFAAAGPDVVRAVKERGAEVFLDLKFHDIPHTVRGAVASAASLGVRLLTVHASGGPAMLRAAVEAAGPECRILAVTVLTSLDAAALAQCWGKPVPDVAAEVLRLAGLARDAGAHGIVCSGLEAGMIRDRYGAALATLVPGVRLAGTASQDQARVVTPRQAADAGARYVVLGRAVTGAKSPRDAMSDVLTDLS